MATRKKKNPPNEVSLITGRIKTFLKTVDSASGRAIGTAECGVYAFFDYDGEPIYVGQTIEGLATRLRRHLTGRRSDAVGKFILDPFEVLEIEVWPLFETEARFPKIKGQGDHNKKMNKLRREESDPAEYQVFQRVLAQSRFDAVLNEKPVLDPGRAILLPASYRGRIIPDELYAERSHPDVRMARRAQTFASLARLISEREVEDGIRTTLLVQAKRLEHLAEERLSA